MHRCYHGRTLNFPFKVDMQDHSSIMHYAQQLTEEIDTRRSAALTKVLNLASRNRELESVCCDMLPASIEPRPSGCVSSLLIPSLGAGLTTPHMTFRCLSDSSQASSLLLHGRYCKGGNPMIMPPLAAAIINACSRCCMCSCRLPSNTPKC